MTIDILVRKAQKGDQTSFVELIHLCEKSLNCIAKSFFKNDEDSADAVQETILKAYKSIKKLKNPEFFKTWITKILINECRKIIKKSNNFLLIEDNYEVYENSTNEIKKIDIKKAINSLEYNLKIIVVLFYFEDFQVREISIILDVPEGTIKSRLSRARAKLAQLLGYYIDENNENIEEV